MSKLPNVKWANKVLKARHFIVLTDKESVIAIDGMDPNSMNDLLALQAQAASIKDFQDMLNELQQRHKVRVAELNALTGITKGGKSAKATGSRTKVPKARSATKRSA